MDPITHGLIGASASQWFADRNRLRPAALVGLTAALLADLDVFIHSSADPLLNVEVHRQFTHSLIFIPAGALIATLLVWWFVRKKLTLPETYGFSFLGYATAGLTDALTSYGTKLLWPFMDERFSWNIISVFDPLFTLGILISVLLTIRLNNKFFVRAAWVWILVYLTFGFVQQKRSESVSRHIAAQHNHQIDRLVVKPTIGNQLLWSIRYQSGDSLYSAGVRLIPFSDSTVYEGEPAPLLNWRQEFASYKGTTLYDDVRRFAVLSDGYLIRHPQEINVVGDARYAMLPTSMSPLWGVKVDTTRPDRHLPFLTFRNADEEVRSVFLEMVMGRYSR